jgi:hypothetical protein
MPFSISATRVSGPSALMTMTDSDMAISKQVLWKSARRLRLPHGIARGRPWARVLTWTARMRNLLGARSRVPTAGVA